MLVARHINQICELTGLATNEISPVKFGAAVDWSAATGLILAQFSVPQDSYLAVMRVECYTVNLTSGAADYGMYEPPPPGYAYWFAGPDVTTVTGNIVTNYKARSHVLLDSDDLIVAPPGKVLTLVGDFSAPSDGATRSVRTLVYSYLIPPAGAMKLAQMVVLEI